MTTSAPCSARPPLCGLCLLLLILLISVAISCLAEIPLRSRATEAAWCVLLIRRVPNSVMYIVRSSLLVILVDTNRLLEPPVWPPLVGGLPLAMAWNSAVVTLHILVVLLGALLVVHRLGVVQLAVSRGVILLFMWCVLVTVKLCRWGPLSPLTRTPLG